MDRKIKFITVKRGGATADLVALPEGGFILQQDSPQFGKAGDVFAKTISGWLNVTDGKNYGDVTEGPLTTNDRVYTTMRENPKQSFQDYFGDLAAKGIIKQNEIPVWARGQQKQAAPITKLPAAIPAAVNSGATAVANMPASTTEKPKPKEQAPAPVAAKESEPAVIPPPADVVLPVAEQPAPVAAVPAGSGQVYDDPIQHALWQQRTEALNKLYVDQGMGRPGYLGNYVNFSVHKDKNGKEWAFDRSTGNWIDVSNSVAGRTSVPSLEEWQKENEGKEATDYDAYVEGEKNKSRLRQQAYDDDIRLYSKGKGFFGTEPGSTFESTIGMLGRPNI